MRLISGLALSGLLLGCGGDELTRSTDLDGSEPLVIGGAATPDELDFAINHLERNAVLGQLADANGNSYQGCSGTLVGDRVVVTAGHCIVLNHDDWFDGAEPKVISPPERVHFAVGDDVHEPLCLLTAETVHLHPEAELVGLAIDHDFAVIILDQSVWDSCPQAIPIQINREPLGEELTDEQLLQGGFGSVDGSYDFSPQRFWSMVAVAGVEDEHVKVIDVGRGLPTFGDSGSGILRRYADGSLRNLGVFSTSGGGAMRFARVDTQVTHFDAFVDDTLLCGAVDELGACRDNVAVRCDEQGFISVDCSETGAQCAADDDGMASCTCPCDTEDYCQQDCPCDAACPCECDATDGCDADCACDAACYEQSADSGGEAEDGGCSVVRVGAAGERGAAMWWLLSMMLAAMRWRSTRTARDHFRLSASRGG